MTARCTSSTVWIASSKGIESSGILSKHEVVDNTTAANKIYNLNFLIIFLLYTIRM